MQSEHEELQRMSNNSAGKGTNLGKSAKKNVAQYHNLDIYDRGAGHRKGVLCG